MEIDVRWCRLILHKPCPHVRRSRDDRRPIDLSCDVPRVANLVVPSDDLDAVARVAPPPAQVVTPFGLGLRLVRAVYMAKSRLHRARVMAGDCKTARTAI